MDRTATTLKSVKDVLGIWPTLAELAESIDESHWTVIKWKGRESIPPKYWSRICEAATSKGERITVDDMMRVHATPRKRSGR